MTERRRFLRFDTALSAICDFVTDRKKSKYEVKNISKEGALLLLDKKLPEGEEIKLTMDVPGDNVPIFASCQVAWQKEMKKDTAYETGVRFTEIDNSNRGRLLEYIYTQWLKPLDNI